MTLPQSMAKDPAFLFYPGDYLRDTQCLSENSQVAYDRIMCEHMRNICITKQQLKFFTKRLSPDEVEELMFTLTEIEGGYQIEWVSESISKRKAYSESRRKNRTSKKTESSSDTSSTYVEHMENENEIEDDNTDVVELWPFEKFWDSYAKKEDRAKCEKKWGSLSVNTKALIMEHVPRYVGATPEVKYRKNPMTYLNSKTWLDESLPVATKTTKPKFEDLTTKDYTK